MCYYLNVAVALWVIFIFSNILIDAKSAKSSINRFNKKKSKSGGGNDFTSSVNVGALSSDTNTYNIESLDFNEENEGDEEGYEESGAAEEAQYPLLEEIANPEFPVKNENSEQMKQKPPSSAVTDTEIIKGLLETNYDWRVRPQGTNLSHPGTHGPVVVNVNMLIRSISKVDDVNMEYSVQITFREQWVDGRLSYGIPNDNKPEFVILPASGKIWMPDSFFQNEKQAHRHNIDQPNVLIRIHKDGQILYSVRLSLVLSCPMHLHDYPMDVQTCLIDLASYAYTSDDIEYKWKDVEPVQLKPGLATSMPSFQLTSHNTTYCTSITNTGKYSCLRTILQLQRQFSYYLLQLYIPSTMLVIVSWVSFWLDRSAVPARVTLGVTTLLTMTTQASGINAKLPPVSYTKAIDVWIGACLTFIFGALLEFACVTYISSRNFYKSNKPSLAGHALHSTKSRTSQHLTTPLLLPNTNFEHLTAAAQLRTPLQAEENQNEVWVKQRASENDVIIMYNEENPSRLHREPGWKNFMKHLTIYRWICVTFMIEDRAKRADYISRIVFPTSFILFNIIYWIRYSRYDVPEP